MQVRMLESVVAECKQLHLKDAVIKWQHRLERSHPIIGMIGTRRLQPSSFPRSAQGMISTYTVIQDHFPS